jgi:ADP-ribose pyrophosphatase YjhB (NUDIX family)
MPGMLLQEILTAAGVREGDTVLDLCAGHQSMEEAAVQAGARYVAVDRVAKCKRSRKAREGWAAVAIVQGDKLLCFKRKVKGGQGEMERMLPGGMRKPTNQVEETEQGGSRWMLPGGTHKSTKGFEETEHDAAMRHLEEQTGITRADCEEYLLDVPISASSAYGARYFVYRVSEWDCSREMKMKMEQNGLEKEWVQFSKADEQASVRPSKWKRWSEARREKHRERMWNHTKGLGAGQVQVQAGTGQAGLARNSGTEQMQTVGGRMLDEEAGAAGGPSGGQQSSERVWETPEGGIESTVGQQSSGQVPRWRAEDSTATETIFRSLSRKR